jgi:hypothetical protein
VTHGGGSSQTDMQTTMNGRVQQSGRVMYLAKETAWRALRVALGITRALYVLLGREQRVDVLVYKVDRLGDWLLAEPTTVRIVAATRAKGGKIVVWAGDESSALRRWSVPDFEVESIALEPKGFIAKLRRACLVVHLLAVYRPSKLICLRYTPEPIRDFVLSNSRALEIHALSRCFAPGPATSIPWEIERHYAILAGAGIQPASPRELLPQLPPWRGAASNCVVVAPFSSAVIKDWLEAGWCELAAGMSGRGLQFELWVSSSQLPRARALARAMSLRSGEESIRVKSGSIADLAASIAQAAVVISVDTFAAHLATAMDAPLICLIGGGHFGDFGPWRKSDRQR